MSIRFQLGVGVEPDTPTLRPPADPKKAEAIARFSKAYDSNPKECENLLAQLDRISNPPRPLPLRK